MKHNGIFRLNIQSVNQLINRLINRLYGARHVFQGFIAILTACTWSQARGTSALPSKSTSTVAACLHLRTTTQQGRTGHQPPAAVTWKIRSSSSTTLLFKRSGIRPGNCAVHGEY